ncbi:MAG: ATPase [Tannerellaceae bacterium]|jgi:V/A-type H+-transporting ATPase subunit I|nr:ATPase [Tannerellaceae bacterium]
MIVKMQKYAFMVYHKEYDAFLSTLRELGVVHVKETKPAATDAGLQEIAADRKRIRSAMHSLNRINEGSGQSPQPLPPERRIDREEGMRLVKSVEELQEKQLQLQAEHQSLSKEIAYMEIWGDFSYERLNRLKQAGYTVTFFACSSSKYDPRWEEEYHAIPINHFQSATYFITITKEGTVIDIDADRPRMPDRGLSRLLTQRDCLLENIAQLDRQLQQLAAADYNTLAEVDRQLQNDFNLANVIVQTDRQADDKLMFLEGWTTEEHTAALEEALDRQGYFFCRQAIEEGDQVPVKLKNGRFSRLYEPLTRMYSLPHYTELDPTPLLAPFFMLFFGLCFGDGGYGLLMLLACTLLKRKVNADYRPYLSLFQWLGGMTLTVGALTGSFFGISLIDVEAFKSVKDYFLDSNNLMTLAIVIGLIHIIFGKAVAAYKTKRQKGLKHSLAPFGWVFTITALIVVYGLPVMDVHLPQPVVYTCYGVAVAGLLPALFYNAPGKSIFLNFGSGLWYTYNMASGLLGDTLSYIRLFAIGLTGSILGGVFNSLAMEMTSGLSIVPRLVAMLLILLVGHSINFALCTISSLVHPLRLIFVEYFKNSEYEGGGKEYLPFRKI